MVSFKLGLCPILVWTLQHDVLSVLVAIINDSLCVGGWEGAAF